MFAHETYDTNVNDEQCLKITLLSHFYVKNETEMLPTCVKPSRGREARRSMHIKDSADHRSLIISNPCTSEYT